MIGAIVGDTIGSVYEFNNKRSKDIELINKDSRPTDDTMMTLAVAEICQKRLYDNKDQIIATFKKWGRTYPDCGYGAGFKKWLFSDSSEAYGSYGNGSAMRISPVGWYARSEEEVEYISERISEVSHNHIEGIKGAKVVAMCIYYARIGKSKEFIREYVERYYDLNFDYDDLKKNYRFYPTCQQSVPQAIYCFLISTSFEDCLRTTISIGGDCDTTAAISCSIAEAYYKNMDNELIKEVLSRLPNDKNECYPREVVLNFYKYQDIVNVFDCTSLDDNKEIVLIESMKNDKRHIEFVYSRTIYSLTRYLINYLIEEDMLLYRSWKLKKDIEANKDDLLISILALDKGKNSSSLKYLHIICESIAILKSKDCGVIYKNNIYNYLSQNYDIDSLILSREYDKLI